nr:hypothetical protein [Tanacetum cinerariifolium]
MKYFREMMHICPRLPGQTFPFEEEILAFLRFLGHSREIRKLADVNINKLHQPWRSFAAIINKCLSGKSTGYDSLRLSQAQILWGLYHKKNVDFAYLLWEDFVYQVEHKDAKKRNEMYYPTFTKVIIHYFMTKDPSIPRRNKNTQQFGVMLPIELTNEDIRNFEAYKEYYAVASGAATPKTKASDDDNQDDDDQDEGDDDDDQDEGNDDDQDTNEEGKEFIHPKLSIYDEEKTKDEESFDPIAKTPEISDDEGIDSLFETTSQMDVLAPTTVSSLTLSTPTPTPSTIATISTVPQAPTPPTTTLSTLLIVQRYMDQWMNEAIKVAVQIQSDRVRDEAQAENEEFIKSLDENIQMIIKEQVKEQVKIQVSKIFLKIEKIMNEQLEAEILIEKMEGNKSIHRSDEQRNLYKALVEAHESDKIILDTYGDIVMLKRRHDDDDAEKDKEPSAGSDRGSKRRREGKKPESTSAPKEKATRTTGKSRQGSKSQQNTASESAPAEELMQTTHDLEETSHQEFKTGVDDDQPIAEAFENPKWVQQQKKPLTPNRDWKKTLPATHGSIQPWISELAKQADSHSSFNELMDTPVDFSAFLMNRLKVDTLTPKLLAGPTYELMKGHARVLGRKRQQFYGFAVNRESAQDVYSKRKSIAVTELKIVEWHNYKHLDWITVRRDDDKLYKFKEGDFKRLYIQDIEDMRVEDLQLGVKSYQKKLNLTKPDTYHSDLKRKEAYTAYFNPRGFIYQNKDKQIRLIRIDELHKFSDGTLNDVRTALDDRLKGIRMKYLPQTIWRKSDNERAAAMIQAIDKQLKMRRIMRSLEKFIGGRLYEGDVSILQRTI